MAIWRKSTPPEAPAVPAAPQVLWLVSLNLPPVPLPRGRSLRIGRKPSCDFVINDRRVSRAHAEVFYKSGVPWIRDLGSHNGTIVDGKKIEGVQRLRVGARIELHDYAFLVSDKPAECPESLSTHYGATTCTGSGTPVPISFRGVLDQIDLPSVLQTLESTAQSGVLSLTLGDGRSGKVGVRLGRPVWASFCDQLDEAALIELLNTANTGQFLFENTNPGIQSPIRRPLAALLLEAARALDESVA